MVSEASRESLEAIRANGWLAKARLGALAVLIEEGPGTARELAAHLPPAENRDITPRLSELRTGGYAIELKRRNCKITGKNVAVWKVANPLPVGRVPLAKRNSKGRVKTKVRRGGQVWVCDGLDEHGAMENAYLRFARRPFFPDDALVMIGHGGAVEYVMEGGWIVMIACDGSAIFSPPTGIKRAETQMALYPDPPSAEECDKAMEHLRETFRYRKRQSGLSVPAVVTKFLCWADQARG